MSKVLKKCPHAGDENYVDCIHCDGEDQACDVWRLVDK